MTDEWGAPEPETDAKRKVRELEATNVPLTEEVVDEPVTEGTGEGCADCPEDEEE